MKKILLLILIASAFWGCERQPIIISPYLMFALRVSNGDQIYARYPDGTNQTMITNFYYGTTSGYAKPTSWNPTNKRVCFISNKDSIGYWHEVYSMNEDGSDVIRLTNNTMQEINPVFSPNGTKILFSATTPSTPYNEQLFMMNSNGSNLVQLTTNFNYGQQLGANWSSDGNKIIFTSRYSSNIFTANTSGSGIGAITSTSNSYEKFNPVSSPDGTKIVVTAIKNSYQKNLYRCSLNSNNTYQLSQLTNFNPNNNSQFYSVSTPSWSPDGTKIAFSSDSPYGGISKNYITNINGTELIEITPSSTMESNPVWIYHQ